MKKILFESDEKRISISSLPLSDEEKTFWQNNLDEKDVLILTCNEFLTEKKINEFKMNSFYLQSIILCNSQKEKLTCDKLKVYCAFINKNCFINENLYKIDESIQKEYDGIYSTSYSNRKRLHLCYDIKSIGILLNYKNNIPHEVKNSLNIINKQTIKEEIYKFYNKAKFGLCLITQDDSSNANAEYLLCGLPVISVHSMGGRNVWYNNYNSIIIDPNKESLNKGISVCLEKIESGKFNCELIRRKQIILMNEFRIKFIHIISIMTGFSYEFCETLFKDKMNLLCNCKIQ